MKVKWLGQSAMLITSDKGLRVITDPFTSGVFGLDYPAIKEKADVVTVSHEHLDHSNTAAVKGNPEVVKGGTKMVRGVEFRAVASYHDQSSGKERGPNTIYCFSIDGINVCHLGDLGQDVSPELQARIGPVDILLIPVGGYFTIDPDTAAGICRRLNPRAVIPMHYKTGWCPQMPFATADAFLALMKGFPLREAGEAEFDRKSLPATMEVVVLKVGS